MQTNSSASLFNDNWSVYQKVILADYMDHAVFYRYVADVISIHTKTEFQFLDIGCGDAKLIAEVLKKYPTGFYKGYDLSNEALALAKESLNINVKQFELIQGSMQELMAAETTYFDIIHACFSIHHLLDEEKNVLYRQISERLNPGGLFLYIDVYRQDEHTVAQAALDYCAWMNSNWHLLTDAEKAHIAEHIQQYDFPATIAFAEQSLLKTGFTKIMSDTSNQRHFIMVFQKPF